MRILIIASCLLSLYASPGAGDDETSTVESSYSDFIVLFPDAEVGGNGARSVHAARLTAIAKRDTFLVGFAQRRSRAKVAKARKLSLFNLTFAGFAATLGPGDVDFLKQMGAIVEKDEETHVPEHPGRRRMGDILDETDASQDLAVGEPIEMEPIEMERPDRRLQDTCISTEHTYRGKKYNLFNLDVTDARSPEAIYTSDKKVCPASRGGDGVEVWILDTGISNHKEFKQGGVNRNGCYPAGGGWGPCKAYDGGMDVIDRVGHGTHVAGTAAGGRLPAGHASRAMVYAHKVLGDDGSGSFSWTVEAIEDLMQRAQQMPTKRIVINMSLGGLTFSCLQSMKSAIDAAVAANIVVVVAAGNSNWNAKWFTPACVKSAITVGATNSEDPKRASWSNYGAVVDIFTVGTDVISASHTNRKRYKIYSGTSMASPSVAGMIATLRSARPELMADEISAFIKEPTNGMSRQGAENVPSGTTDLLMLGVSDAALNPTPMPSPMPSPTP